MPTVICSRCGKPWMDRKYRFCPNCGMAGSASQPSGQAARPTPSAAAMPASNGPDAAAITRTPPSLTYAQGQKIIDLLEGRRHTSRRVPVADRAQTVSDVLSTFAFLSLVVGGLGAVFAVISLATAGLLTGLLTLLVVVAGTALYWASFTFASVVAGYIANRS